MLSIPHMIVVFIVVLVVFGPQKLPELARGLGKLMAEFRKASTDFKSTAEDLVISPVVESVPRTSEGPSETKTEAAAVTNSQETPHDNQHPA